MTNANQMLMSGGGVHCQFPKIGHEYVGTVLSWTDPVQQVDFKDKKPQTFPDGKPRMQFTITLATSARGKYVKDLEDPDSEWELEDVADDDGIRTLYVKNREMKAIRNAIRNAKGQGLEVGALLTIRRIKPTALTNKRMHDFEAEWVLAKDNPAASAANALINEEENPFED